MSYCRRLLVAALVSLALCVPAVAGEIHTGGVTDQAPAVTGDIHAGVAGDMSAGIVGALASALRLIVGG